MTALVSLRQTLLQGSIRNAVCRWQRTPFSYSCGSPFSSSRWFSDDSTSEEQQQDKVKKKTRPKPDPAIFVEEVKIYMPDVGAENGKIIKWYFNTGDLVKRNDVLCDIETPDFSFGMVTDDDCDAMMGEILVEADSDPVEVSSVICTVFHPKEQSEEEEDSTTKNDSST